MSKYILLLLSFVLLPLSVIANELSYDYSDLKGIPIYLNIVKQISTKDSIYEGQEIEFKTLLPVQYSEKTILEKNQIVKARIETIITSGMNGFPAEIVIDNFQIPNIPQSQLLSTYTKYGQNRCIIVYPIKWALTFLPPTGSLTNLIKGGHAKIKKSDVVTVYYYPNWK